jgi:PAS domain S-box-containing protein
MFIREIEDISKEMERKRSSGKNLKATKLLLSQTIDFLPDPTFAIDLRGKVIVWNRAMEELTQIRAEDMIGKADYEYALPFYDERRPILIDLVLHPDPDFDTKYTSIQKKGDSLFAETVALSTKRFLWGKASPIHDNNGQIIGAIESIRDITELRRAEEALLQSEKKYHDIFLNVSDLLMIHDLKGNFIETNLASKKSTGYTEADLKDMNLKDILPGRYKARFKDYISRVLENGSDEGLMTIVAKTGDERTLEYRNSLILDPEGRPAGVRGSARDITSRIRAAKRLKKEHDFITSIIQTSPAFYDAIDPQGKTIFMNQAMLNALGYSLSDVVDKDYLEQFIPAEDRRAFKDAMDTMVSSRKPVVHENRVLSKDGKTLLVQWQGKAMYHENGEIEFIYGIGIDITEQRRAQELIFATEKKFETVFHSSPVPSAITDIETGMILAANRALESLSGFTLEEALGKTSLDIGIWKNPADRDRIIRKIATGNPVDNEEVVYRVRSGEIRNILYTGRLIDVDGKPHILSHALDITEHKRSEQALKESEERYRILAENARDVIWILDLDLKYLYMSPSIKRLRGYSAEEVMKQSLDQILTPESYRRAMEIFHKELGLERMEQIHGPDWSRTIEIEMFCRDGSTVWTEVIINLLYDKEGTLTSFMGITRDITKRRQAEEALRQSEERFRIMAEVSPEIFWMATPGWEKVIYVSPAFERIIGMPVDEVYRDPRAWLNLVHHEDSAYVSSTIGFGQEHAADGEYDFRIIRKDGAMRWIHNRRYAVHNSQGDLICFTGMAEDITERKQAEEDRSIYEVRLMRSQKLEAIGTLAGGIAHDFNNILSAIIGYSELALDDLPKDNSASMNIEEVLKAGERAKELVKQILTFSRQRETERRPVKIDLIIKEALKLLRSSIPSSITISNRIDSSTCTVFADPTQIHQVIMNLCTNAYHAMLPNGGNLTVSLEQLYLDTGFISRHPPLHEGTHVRLTVSDTGCGMDQETLKRIFDPFFTTKEKTKGTGLGLATVHGIVTDLGGAIFVTSTIGKGSSFELYLPIFGEENDELESFIEAPPQGKGESILLVDDEEAILNFSKTMLEQLGYKFKGISSSIEALKIFRSAPDKLDLVLTDQTMPGMTGSALAIEILTIRPDMPIILMTGYSETITPEEVVAQGIKEYIEKPFTKNIIAAAIHRSLKR